MSASVRIADMPDLGAVTDASSVVGEQAGSGRFTATALRVYCLSSGPITGPIVVSLPTSNAGLVPGTLWNNGGFVCVA